MTLSQELRKAIDAHEAGYPSLLPDSNHFKALVEQHRWGNRSGTHAKHCPICLRESRA